MTKTFFPKEFLHPLSFTTRRPRRITATLTASSPVIHEGIFSALIMPFSASLRNPLITSVPVKVRERVGVDDVDAVDVDLGFGGSRRRISRRSSGAEDRDAEVPKRDCTVKVRFLETCGSSCSVLVRLGGLEVEGSASSGCWFSLWCEGWFMCSSGVTVLDGRGSRGLPSRAASAKMLNAPVDWLARPGPRRERSAWRLFAVREVGLRV